MGLTSAYTLAGQKTTEILVAIAKRFPNRVIPFLPSQEQPFATQLSAMKWWGKMVWGICLSTYSFIIYLFACLFI